MSFAKLSIFQGGFNAHAARTITNADLFQLHTFIDKSLLQADGDRFVIHELLRQYAAEKRDELLDTSTLRQAHSRYYLDFITSQKEIIVGNTPRDALDKITADLDNIRQAWQTAVSQQQTTAIINSANTIADYFQIRGLYREGEQLFAAAANQLTSAASSEEKARLIAHQASMFVRMSAYQPAITTIQQALTLLNNDETSWVFSRLHITWGETLWRQGDLVQAAKKLTIALQTARKQYKPALQAYALFHLGIVHDYRGELDSALTYFEDALTLWRQLSNRRQQGFTLNSIGLVASKLSDNQKAKNSLNEALLISRENNDLQGQSMALNNLSLIATNEQQFSLANDYLLDAKELAKYTGDEYTLALLTYNLGWNSLQDKKIEPAIIYGKEALQLRQKIGDIRGEAKALHLLGRLEIESDRLGQAKEYLFRALELSQQATDHQTEKEIIEAIEQVRTKQK